MTLREERIGEMPSGNDGFCGRAFRPDRQFQKPDALVRSEGPRTEGSTIRNSTRLGVDCGKGFSPDRRSVLAEALVGPEGPPTGGPRTGRFALVILVTILACFTALAHAEISSPIRSRTPPLLTKVFCMSLTTTAVLCKSISSALGSASSITGSRAGIFSGIFIGYLLVWALNTY